MRRTCSAAALFLCLLAGHSMADVINYQGRVTMEGKPFNGTGRFKFAIIDDQGTAAWSTGEMTLYVRGGIYAVRLGDSTQAPPIDSSLLRQGAAPKLRIWFEEQGIGWTTIGDDIPLATRGPLPVNSAPAAGESSAMMGGEGAAILAELRAIHALLTVQQGAERRPAGAVQPVMVSVANRPSLGKENAPLVLVEFTDFQNPLCAWFQDHVFGPLKSKYVDTGSLRFVSEILPQPFDSSAELAARVAVCARAKGKYWQVREKLLSAGKPLTLADLNKLDFGMDPAKLAADASSKQTDDAIMNEVSDANSAGIESAPSFVLGTAMNGKVTGIKITGAQTFDTFQGQIEKTLRASGGP